MPGAPTCQGRVLTEVGPGTKAKTKVQLIAELWPCRGSRGARALLRIRPLPLTGQSGDQMIYLPYGGTEAGARLPPIALNCFCNFIEISTVSLTVLSLTSDRVGPGTVAGTNARLISQLLATSGLPMRPGPLEDPPPRPHRPDR